MARWLYSLLLYLAFPLVAAWFLWRGRRTPAHRGSLRARLAMGLAPRDDRPLWLHAASIGELRALSALLPHLDRGPLLVTIGTPAGLTRAREMFAQSPHVHVMPAPWDLPGAVRRFISHARPRAGVFVETELWPNLIHAARKQHVPLTLVSARLSRRSLRRYRRFAAGLMRRTVRSFAAIGAQSEADRVRFLALGAAPETVSVTGNLKFDLPLDPALEQKGAALHAQWAARRWLWVAGSTHQDEEQILLDAHREFTTAMRTAGMTVPLLALAPRRPERFTAVSRWLDRQDMRHARSSEARTHAAGDHLGVILIDEMGTLPAWYAAAEAAFVGGSLVPVGGHNLLEPAALARPVLTGPQVFNAPDVADVLLEANGARMVYDAEQLASQLLSWAKDEESAHLCGSRAARAVAEHRGAAAQAAALVRASAAESSAPSASG